MSTQSWRKMGKVFCPQGQAPWLHSHAAVPIAEQISGDQFRIYFSSRDEQNRSHTGELVIDLNQPQRILDLSSSPVLAPGELGCFDDSGAMATWLVSSGDTRYLYYIGWNLGVTVPFRNSIGLAISRGGAPFERAFAGPILDRTHLEPHFCASCCVMKQGDEWLMWYLSCTRWEVRGKKPDHRYHIKNAQSSDGINWHREGQVAIDYQQESERAISRPSVLHDEDGWHMWYSHRGEAYRIGYASSEDGNTWQRHDDRVGIDVSKSGWDADMIEYPFVFDHQGQRFMLYNGNGFGQTGVGLAIWE